MAKTLSFNMKKTNGVRSKKEQMILEGVPASPGITVGPCYLYSAPSWQPEPQVITDEQIADQIKYFRAAVKKAHQQLQKSYQQTHEQFGDDVAEVMHMQIGYFRR